MALHLPLQAWQCFKQKATWRTRPLAQNLIAGLVLCLLPGVYLALTSLGAGGGRSSSETLASNVNAILYGVFAGTGWLGGIVMNLLGPKLTIASSAIGYIAYTAGLFYFDTSGKSWLAYMGGALEGVCAGLLWASAGAIAYSYAEERRKAFYVTIQWVCCVGGSTIAAIIALGIDLHSRDESAGAPTSVYGVLISLQASSIAVSLLLLVRPSEVQRSDGLRIANLFNSSAMDELCGTWELVKEWRFILLLPAMFSGEVTLAQQSSLNAHYFDLRTRSLNNILFNSVQIPASLGITWVLDRSRLSSRKHRSLVAISIVTVFTVSVCSCQIAWLSQHRIDRKGQGSLTDWKDSAFGGAFAIYILYGAVYGAFQMATQYLLSSFTNEPLKQDPFPNIIYHLMNINVLSDSRDIRVCSEE
ncbi:uncharacterized protein KD926_002832 [Aspergillus affinis]|uniref:uncharacterized protein n=1 Tax=Aspergillus affinis TaxID=1070780 RepID=UPI0022FDDAF7|nr:uncharacterized protein KD926_002832 [Aspergillus affinis]KAI9035850.1 hypothetical protein KD926_002832 [Aspergillus affinis]